MAEEKKGSCAQCGCANCTCSSKSCPFAKTDKVLSLILKVVKIIVFIALAYVLFDIHAVIKQTEKNYAAATGMPAGVVMPQGAANQP